MMLISAFSLRFKANYLKKCVPIPVFLGGDFNSPRKDLLFPHGPGAKIFVCSRHRPFKNVSFFFATSGKKLGTPA